MYWHRDIYQYIMAVKITIEVFMQSKARLKSAFSF